MAARERQRARLAGSGALCNGEMDGRLTRRQSVVGDGAIARLLAADALTGRGHDRVLRLARTIADLEGRAEVRDEDVDEALGYRLATAAPVAA